MTKKQAAGFFFGGTGIFLVLFVGLTIHSHTRFPELTNAQNLTPLVLEGKDVWHRESCVNCHTLMGEGAYYAPDLTRITALRGEAYLAQFLAEPTRFYSEEEHGRIMTNPNLAPHEIEAVIAFLDWIDGIDNFEWPPRPILVTGTAFAGLGGSVPGAAASDDPVALGEFIFRSTPPACFSCHSTSPGVILAGPSVANMATRAGEVLEDPAYEGSATTPEEFVRESILEPSAYLHPGSPTFSAMGQSVMPGNYGETLSAEEVEYLVAYLMTLR
jgi:nitric oxide reductase subunit C